MYLQRSAAEKQAICSLIRFQFLDQLAVQVLQAVALLEREGTFEKEFSAFRSSKHKTHMVCKGLNKYNKIRKQVIEENKKKVSEAAENVVIHPPHQQQCISKAGSAKTCDRS